MAKYSYCNGVYEVTTLVRHGWKRFHSMNAQYQILQREGFKYWNFISYDTPICRVSHITYGGHDYWNMNVSCFYDCSPSTKRQFARFLREYGLPYSLRDIDCYMANPSDELQYGISLTSCERLNDFYLSDACMRNSFPCHIVNE